MKVAHYEVVGKRVSKMSSVPLGTIETSVSLDTSHGLRQPIDRPSGTELSKNAFSHHFRSGLLSNVPAGLIPRPGGAVRPDRNLYVDAHGRLADVVRSRSLPGWLSRFSSGKNKAVPNTRARHTEQTPGEQRGGDKQAGGESDPDTDGS